MIAENLRRVQERIAASSPDRQVLLVAVSKTRPATDIVTACAAGHCDFGENYVQELVDKAQALKTQCPDIRWHFIGALQSNKIAKLMSDVPNLETIQTVDSVAKLEKILRVVREGREKQDRIRPLGLFLQVNVSGETAKHGMQTVAEIAEAVRVFQRAGTDSQCVLTGLMSIGEPDEAARDFDRMCQLQREIAVATGWHPQLSMGMTDDYELAVAMGSNLVRVGRAIFGERANAESQ